MDDEEAKKFYCETILEETDKLNILINKITSLSKLEYGYQEIILSKFSIKYT